MREILITLTTIIIILTIFFSGCEEQINGGNENNEINSFQDPPTIYGIGINLTAWNSETNMAGDLYFYEDLNKVFLEYGQNEGGLNVHPEFYAPIGTKIYSVSEGSVIAISKIEHTNDYNIGISRGDGDLWSLNYEHIINPYVEVGDWVQVGDLIAEVSPVYDNYGLWALMIVTQGNTEEDHLTHCPYDLLHESVKEKYQSQILQLIEDWEEFKGEDVYNEDEWLCLGCAFEKFTEAEARGGDLVSSDDPKLRQVIEALQQQIEDEANRLIALENEIDDIIENDLTITQEHYEEMEDELESLQSIGSENYDRVRTKLDSIRSNIV